MTMPPEIPVRPVSTTLHGHTRVDPYHWMRERDDPAVLAHLQAENTHTEAAMEPVEGLRQTLFEEFKARIQETDLSVPVLYRGWYYYSRTEEGRQYPCFCRRKGSLAAGEEIYLDENALAEGHEYFDLGGVDVSPDGAKLAWSTDTEGSELFVIRVKDLVTGEEYPERIPNTSDLFWAADNRHLFYTVRDAAKRPYRLHRHEIGTDPARDVLVFEEADALYNVEGHRTRNDAWIIIASVSSTTSEMRVIPADRPTEPARLIEPRQENVEYYLDHADDLFYIRTNLEAKNFRVMTAPVASPGRANWREILPHRPGVKVEDIDVFAGFWAASERDRGLEKLRVTDRATGDWHEVAFPEPDYTVGLAGNRTFETTLLRFKYQSMTTPGSVYDYDVVSRQRTLLKRDPVLGPFDPSDYRSERVFARSGDGAEIPISLAYRRGTPLDGSAPLYLYGYGAYGITINPTFSHFRLSLLDRGVIFAIAHVRGGGVMGEPWHDDGKMMNKRNSFTDFIACAEHLLAKGYTQGDRLVASGGSAGGLLMGAVINMRPDLFRAAVLDVPFVDVLNTMLDASLPLTVGEYLEWGNPNEAAAYHYIKTYCPYTNVQAQRYPALLITVGLNDPRVPYWEGAKLAAKLRAVKLDDNPLLVKVNLEAGHAGQSGRYNAWREIAFRYAFLLKQLGMAG